MREEKFQAEHYKKKSFRYLVARIDHHGRGRVSRGEHFHEKRLMRTGLTATVLPSERKK